jgi:hypothetical protein
MEETDEQKIKKLEADLKAAILYIKKLKLEIQKYKEKSIQNAIKAGAWY